MKIENIILTVFPGTNKDVTFEEVRTEIQSALQRIEHGDFEELELSD